MTRSEAARILGISPQANEDTIKKAFRKKAMKLHPDRNKAANARSQFIEVHEAYEYLSDLAAGRTTETYSSRQKTHTSTQNSKFRSSHHKHRHYADPYADMNREEFEERFNRARKAAEEALNRESEIIYKNSLNEYQNTWRRKLAKYMAVIGLIIAILFITDFSLGTYKEQIDRSEVELLKTYENHNAVYYLMVYDTKYQLPDDLRVLFGNDYIISNGKKTPLLNQVVRAPKNKPIEFTVNKTYIFKDLVGITIHSGKYKYELQPIFSVYGSFPIIPLLLLIPFLSFWFEKPNFNFVFFIVNYNIYVFPILVIILLFHDGRLLRLCCL